MKYASGMIVLFSFIMSCKTADKKEVPAATLVEEFKPYLHGTWVLSPYIDEIIKTKSPLKASGKLSFISEFSIDTTGLEGDSLNIGAGFGNHEGGNFILYFQRGQNSASLLTSLRGWENEADSYELSYTIYNHDTSLVLFRYDKNKKALESTKFIRARGTERGDDDSYGLQWLVNKNLMTGSYKMIDTTGQESIVQLTNEGLIKGFRGHRTYYVLTDFVAGPENATDEICFEIATSNQKCYGFEFKADTLCLFEPAKDETDTLFKPGPPVYRFVKEK